MSDFTRRHSLVMLSGGIDSLYVLHQLLATSDDVVWAHHVNLINREGRHQAESQACANIVAWCTEHVRAFRYTESTVDHSAFTLFGRDMLTVAFEAGVVTQNAHVIYGRGFDRVLLGYCQEESEEVSATPNRRSIVEAVLSASAHPIVPPRLERQPLIRKQAQIEAMPTELARLAWTCRTPVRGAECGRCKTCLLMAPIRAALSAKHYPLPSPQVTA